MAGDARVRDGWASLAARWPLALAFVLGLTAVVEAVSHGPAAEPIASARPLSIAVLILIGLAATTPVSLVDGRPATAAVLTTTAVVVYLVLVQSVPVAGGIAQLVCGYRLGQRGPRGHRPVALGLATVFPLLILVALSSVGSVSQAQPVGTAPSPAPEPAVEFDGATALLAVLAVAAPIAVLAGIARGSAREAARGRAASAALSETLLENTARGERARIARELHDVVAHHISMVAVQAETARLTTPDLPEAGAERLRAIGDTARTALTEMRRLLGVLREDTEADTAALTPQPGLRLRELNALIDSARAATPAAIRLRVTGTVVRLDPGVELAGYRIIQEALTNARRHAPSAAVEVRLHYGADRLLLTVHDTGPGPGSAAEGLGLTGMRERAAAVGGRLTTGSAAGGGFRVEARLPGTAATGPTENLEPEPATP